MKTGILVQVRTSSTRLPNKALLPLAGAPVIQRIIERLKKVPGVELIIATSVEVSDDPIEQLCQKTSTKYFRGDLHDVLKRFVDAARYFKLDNIIRVTGDCPLIEPGIIAAMLQEYKKQTYDYYSNILPRSFPRGLDTEIFPLRFLEQSYEERIPADVQENVVIPYLNRNIEKIRIGNYADATDHSRLRWTLDEKADYDLICEIYNELYPTKEIFSYRDTLDLFQRRPELAKINANVRQKLI